MKKAITRKARKREVDFWTEQKSALRDTPVKACRKCNGCKS